MLYSVAKPGREATVSDNALDNRTLTTDTPRTHCEDATTIRLFHDPPLQGTRATVRPGGRPPSDAEARRHSREDASEASCWVWKEEAGLQVRCYNNGHPVRFCGHGLLASVFTWLRRHPDTSRPLRVDNGRTCYTLDEDDGFWLHCARIPWKPVDAIPGDWFDTPPEATALAGDDDGYWILRWPTGFDLHRLQPRLSTIARESRRAVIATAAGKSGGDVRLRYFAPAHGNPEDSVTGSAAVVLAGYWQQPELVLEQCSPRGGRLVVRLDTDGVALSGPIEEIRS